MILAVIPKPIACLKESERVLRKGGEIVVFDKFVRKNGTVSNFRRIANMLTNFMFSDITRDFESIACASNLSIISDLDADFNGNFRQIKLIKN